MRAESRVIGQGAHAALTDSKTVRAALHHAASPGAVQLVTVNDCCCGRHTGSSEWRRAAWLVALQQRSLRGGA